jgi:phosphatidylglycerol:prolipoprotein diacylglycerol transferase
LAIGIWDFLFGMIAAMFPTFSFGPLVISTYTLFIDLGILGVLAWLWYRAPAHNRQPSRWLDAGLTATAGALLGGRIAFALANWAYFQNHFFEIFRLWEGGYAWIGAAAGGLIALLIYCRTRSEPLPLLLDELALPVTLLSALGWAGCAAASCAAGQTVPPGTLPFAVNWPDLYGVILPRWPTQLIGFFLSLIAFGLLLAQRNAAWPQGVRFALSMTFVALITFLVSTVRGDDMPLVGTWRLDAVANAIVFGLGLLATVAAWALEPAKPKEQPNPEDAKVI